MNTEVTQDTTAQDAPVLTVDHEVINDGEQLGIVAWSKEEAEKWCIEQTARTGRRHDWHFSMGRVVLYRLDVSKDQLSEGVKRFTAQEETLKHEIGKGDYGSGRDCDVVTIHMIRLKDANVLTGSSVCYNGEPYDEVQQKSKARMDAVTKVNQKSIEDLLEEIRLGMVTQHD